MTMDAFELKRRFKLQAKALAKLIDFGPEPEGLVNRASGNAVCEICGLETLNAAGVAASKLRWGVLFDTKPENTK
jgi:hypothetical protein